MAKGVPKAFLAVPARQREGLLGFAAEGVCGWCTTSALGLYSEGWGKALCVRPLVAPLHPLL